MAEPIKPSHDDAQEALKVVYSYLFFADNRARRLLPLVAYLQGEVADFVDAHRIFEAIEGIEW